MQIKIATLYSYLKYLYFTLMLGKDLKGFEHINVLWWLQLAVVGRMAYGAILNCTDLSEMLWTWIRVLQIVMDGVEKT